MSHLKVLGVQHNSQGTGAKALDTLKKALATSKLEHLVCLIL